MTGEQAYRPDIDGLRAVAVLSVLFYHARHDWVPGGLVGVDIFFVISGYLICGQIFREALAGRFRYADFYARRVRRILPALLLVVTTCLVTGWLVLTPLELRALGREATAAIFGLSNVFYYGGDDYFGPAAQDRPLLMTWSLGVEEQFYLIFPILLLGLMRVARGRELLLITLLSILSFGGSLLLTELDAKAAFYLPFTRSWELGAGAVLAIAQVRGGGSIRLPEPWASIAGIGGLGLIGAALALFRPGMDFPGLFALLPVAGTALLLLGEGGAVNRHVLSWWPMRVIGWLSYSLYLWHWPVLYLFRVLGEGSPGSAALPWIVALPLVLAALTWWLVERPFRYRLLPRGTVLAAYGMTAAMLGGVAALLYLAEGVPQRLPEPARDMALAASRGADKQCLALYGERQMRNPATCYPRLREGQSARLVLLGDSHANAIAPAIVDLAAAGGEGLGRIAKSSCLPLIGFGRDMADRPNHLDECIAFQRDAFARALTDPSVRRIVLAGYWAAALEDPIRARRGAPAVTLERALEETISGAEAAGKSVTLVLDAPMFAFDPYAREIGGQMAWREWLTGWAGTSATRLGLARPLPDPTRAVLIRLARRHPRLRLLDPRMRLCAGALCRYARDGQLYYMDSQHLTPEGAKAAISPHRPLT